MNTQTDTQTLISHDNKLGDMIPSEMEMFYYKNWGSNMCPEHNQEPDSWFATALKPDNWFLLSFAVISSGLPCLFEHRPEKKKKKMRNKTRNLTFGFYYRLLWYHLVYLVFSNIDQKKKIKLRNKINIWFFIFQESH